MQRKKKKKKIEDRVRPDLKWLQKEYKVDKLEEKGPRLGGRRGFEGFDWGWYRNIILQRFLREDRG